ncbi:hypothetical protein BDY19DRAFT_997044 [Irpex rosettiformis]|uniref:Uncharacterized protein n=1 Tax=Irpex rosettiformis TaxID=378272 RepID=A0ACB8TT13_9APHY|nr:hypothetical protein BDY19DRAFT_997044 [Irpex rosettiformis]
MDGIKAPAPIDDTPVTPISVPWKPAIFQDLGKEESKLAIPPVEKTAAPSKDARTPPPLEPEHPSNPISKLRPWISMSLHDTSACGDKASIACSVPKAASAQCHKSKKNLKQVHKLDDKPEPVVTSKTEPAPWDTFVSLRSQLLQEAIRDSVRTGTFHDVEIYAYSKRNKSTGSVHTPTIVYARKSFLEAASPILKGLLTNGKRHLNRVPPQTWDYEYLEDSDLNDANEFDDVDSVQASDFSEVASDISAFDSLPTPRSVGRCADDLESHPTQTTSTVTPESPPHEVVYVPFGAAKTWQALIAYLYDGVITFTPLRKGLANHGVPKSTNGLSCCPKSMYRLARKLELTALAELCEEAIVAALGTENIVNELFSDFTWRYSDILSREVTVFMRHSQDSHVRADLKQAFRDMALGKLPRRDAVLSALFDAIL